MGLKLEILLIIGFVFIIGLTTTLKLSNSTSTKQNQSKELEFIDTTFIEVDKEKLQAHSFATYGVRDAGVLRLEHLVYKTDNIKLLLADKGRYLNNVLYLDGNVSLKEINGYLYRSEHAQYNQKTEILEISSPFTAYRNKNIFKGNWLVYDAHKKELNATRIDAIIYTSEK